jgi:hypothetical protein
MGVANTLAYYNTATITAVKSFIGQAPGVLLIDNSRVMLQFAVSFTIAMILYYRPLMVHDYDDISRSQDLLGIASQACHMLGMAIVLHHNN